MEYDMIQTLSIVAAATVGAVFGIQKLIRDWRTTKAESDIISVLHQEIERMSKQNTTLSTQLNTLQLEIVELNQQLTKLNIENNKLQEEVAALTIELNNFKKLAALRKVKV